LINDHQATLSFVYLSPDAIGIISLVFASRARLAEAKFGRSKEEDEEPPQMNNFFTLAWAKSGMRVVMGNL
jgi:hypothetical protein